MMVVSPVELPVMTRTEDAPGQVRLVLHETENLLEYALAARTEHRLDGAKKHTMEILFECALATSNLLSEHSSDGEVMDFPNTFKETIESP